MRFAANQSWLQLSLTAIYLSLVLIPKGFADGVGTGWSERYEAALRSPDRALQMESLQAEAWGVLFSVPGELDGLGDREFNRLILGHIRSSLGDEPERVHLQDELVASLRGDPTKWASLSVTSLSRLDRVAGWLRVPQTERSDWLRTYVESGKVWREAPLGDLASLLRLLSHRAEDVDLGVTHATVADHAWERLESASVEAWVADYGASSLVSFLVTEHADAARLKDLRTKLMHDCVEDEAVFRGLTPEQLHRVVSIGSSLGVDKAELARWRVSWLVSSDSWQSLPPEGLRAQLRQLERLAGKVDAGPAWARVSDHVLGRASSDGAWFVSALRSGLLDTLRPKLVPEGAARLREVISRQMASVAVLDQLDSGGLERSRVLAARLGVPSREVGSWLTTWVATNERWKQEGSKTASWALWVLDLYAPPPEASEADEAAVREARSRVLDHILASAGEPGWLDGDTFRGWATFVTRVWSALQADPRMDAGQRKAAIAQVLNAPTPAPGSPALGSLWGINEGRLLNAQQARSRWYTSMQLPSGGRAADELMVAVHEGLLFGEVRPLPTTLALVNWYERSLGELAAWQLNLDDRIASATPGTRGTPGSSDRVMLLLGRAYAAEIERGHPTVLRGEKWLRQAYSEASGDVKVQVGQIIAMQLAAAGRFDEAEVLLTELESMAVAEAGQRSLASLRSQLPRLRHESERDEALQERRVEEAQALARAERARRREAGVSGAAGVP